MSFRAAAWTLMAGLLAGLLLAGLAPAADAAKLDFRKVAKVEQPTSLASPPGYRRLVFVTERQGRIRLLRRGKLSSRPLLDISKRVRSVAIEQGLLGIAFPPDFKRTGRFYLDYTAGNGDSVVEEYRTVPGQPTRLKPNGRRTVLRIPRVNDRGNHNGGRIAFHDGLLYISVGDGYNPGDRPNNAQNLNRLRGKILRIDPRPGPGGAGYRIPADNPFVGRPGRDEIFAYGFRNPHSFNFATAGGEQMMVITDVGQGRFEELNYLSLAEARGANFGWHAYEGYQPYDCGELCPNGGPPEVTAGLTWPQLVYTHDDGCAIIGGPVVRDPDLSSIDGRIIYGDFCSNRIRTAAPARPKITDDRPAGFFLPPGEGEYSALNGFGVDGLDHVYAFTNFGGIYRIVQR